MSNANRVCLDASAISPVLTTPITRRAAACGRPQPVARAFFCALFCTGVIFSTGHFARAQTLAETAVAGALTSTPSLQALSAGTPVSPPALRAPLPGILPPDALPHVEPVRVAPSSGVGGGEGAPAPVVLMPTAQKTPPEEGAAADLKQEKSQDSPAGPDLNPADADDMLRRLRDPASGPLTISQLATLNDAVKRMEYLNEIEKKMAEMNLNVGMAPSVSSSPRAGLDPGPVSLPPSGNMDSASSTPLVMRIMGAKGEYAAVLSYNGTQARVMPGDTIGAGMRVISVSLSGVRVTTPAGSIASLPFLSPSGYEGVSASTRGGR